MSSCAYHLVVEEVDGPVKVTFAGDNVWGVVAVSTSFITNLLATSLIAYRTW